MGGEQDMRRMGGLKKYMPVTFATMMIGTLAIAGIPPFAGFFSKDEILYRAFLQNKLIWSLAVLTALMTAFYMFRLMYMTFYGAYRGPAWEAAGHGHGDAHGHSPAHGDDAHGHADAHGAGDRGDAAADDHGHGHGHGAWHGPHESPTRMTFPLMALAIGAMVAGFVGVPAALLPSGSTIERFLEPSFTVSEVRETPAAAAGAAGTAVARAEPPVERAAKPAGAAHEEGEPHMSQAGELGLMVFSVLVALAGVGAARKFYVANPEISEHMKERFAAAHVVLSNKYYVDELYDATAISGTKASGRGLWAFDRNVIDGAVNGTGWVTLFSSWVSGLTDKRVVDGAVNAIGWTAEESSYWFRRLQTGLVQNYALLMLFGVAAFVGLYLIVR
jgi:NADH-quinone oxidoreductase subunit L